MRDQGRGGERGQMMGQGRERERDKRGKEEGGGRAFGGR